MDLEAEIASAKALLLGAPGIAKFALIGSATFMAAEEVADVDFAVLLKPGVRLTEAFERTFTFDEGWGPCSEYDTSAAFEWAAVRRENLNLMVSTSERFYDGYLRAMEVIKLLDLRNKADRIAVCAVVRDGIPAREAVWKSSNPRFMQDRQ